MRRSTTAPDGVYVIPLLPIRFNSAPAEVYRTATPCTSASVSPRFDDTMIPRREHASISMCGYTLR
jgi:hypothetical protein